MTKLTSLVDTYLYISRNIDAEILQYLNETEEAVSFITQLKIVKQELKSHLL